MHKCFSSPFPTSYMLDQDDSYNYVEAVRFTFRVVRFTFRVVRFTFDLRSERYNSYSE